MSIWIIIGEIVAGGIQDAYKMVARVVTKRKLKQFAKKTTLQLSSGHSSSMDQKQLAIATAKAYLSSLEDSVTAAAVKLDIQTSSKENRKEIVSQIL